MVLSAKEKAVDNSQVCVMELNESEVFDEASLILKYSQNLLFLTRSDKFRRNLVTG
ncbi:MAG: hypothetical protein GX995_02480 [Clostridiales bacterium]|nr:hypothetical protein [Clostridiales bacterium]